MKPQYYSRCGTYSCTSTSSGGAVRWSRRTRQTPHKTEVTSMSTPPITSAEAAAKSASSNSPVGIERRRRKRAKITAQVHMRAANTPEPFEEICKSVDVSRDGLLVTSARAGYWKGQRLDVTFPVFHSRSRAEFLAARRSRARRRTRRPLRRGIAIHNDQVRLSPPRWIRPSRTHTPLAVLCTPNNNPWCLPSNPIPRPPKSCAAFFPTTATPSSSCPPLSKRSIFCATRFRSFSSPKSKRRT